MFKFIIIALFLCLSFSAWSFKQEMSPEQKQEWIKALKLQAEEAQAEEQKAKKWKQRLFEQIGLIKTTPKPTLSEVLSTRNIGQEWDEESLRLIARAFGVKIFVSVDTLPDEARVKCLGEALNTYSLLPLQVMQDMKDIDNVMDLLGSKITDHKGQQRDDTARYAPRGYSTDTKWDSIPGVGATNNHPTIINITSLTKNHGSVDLILHEMAHSIDRYRLAKTFDILSQEYSESREFKQLIAKTPWNKLYESNVEYYSKTPEEHFAEMFAQYFHSEESRNKLKSIFPEAFEYYSTTFPE